MKKKLSAFSHNGQLNWSLALMLVPAPVSCLCLFSVSWINSCYDVLHNHVQSCFLVEQNGSSFMLSITMWCGGWWWWGATLDLCVLFFSPLE
ncbi:hypothetical protein DL98DRAFT_119274 [Cadophora sp. DSE1049]|nr:hypothetical protein DL98DRAFT_119274 [Cadophora sp. DSE1049]